jgi:hypothetical protein
MQEQEQEQKVCVGLHRQRECVCVCVCVHLSVLLCCTFQAALIFYFLSLLQSSSPSLAHLLTLPSSSFFSFSISILSFLLTPYIAALSSSPLPTSLPFPFAPLHSFLPCPFQTMRRLRKTQKPSTGDSSHCTVLCSTVLHYTVLHIAQHSTQLYCTPLISSPPLMSCSNVKIS